MFEVGFTEIVLIMALALLVLGPEKLPGLARKIGRWTGRARSMARQLRMQLEQETTIDELARSSRPQPPPRPRPQHEDPAFKGAAGTAGPAPAPDAAPIVEPTAGEPGPSNPPSESPEKTASP